MDETKLTCAKTQLGKDNSEKNHDVKEKYDAVLLFREQKLVFKHRCYAMILSWAVEREVNVVFKPRVPPERRLAKACCHRHCQHKCDLGVV